MYAIPNILLYWYLISTALETRVRPVKVPPVYFSFAFFVSCTVARDVRQVMGFIFNVTYPVQKCSLYYSNKAICFIYCCYSVVFHEKQLLKLDALADSEQFHYFSRFHCQMATLYCTILYHTVLPLQYGTVQYSTV